MYILRVEVLHFLKRNTDDLAYLLQMELLVDLECVDMNRHANCLRLDAVLLIICHGVERSYECRTVSSGFSWKVWVDIPECSLSAASSDCLVHISCSAVI